MTSQKNDSLSIVDVPIRIIVDPTIPDGQMEFRCGDSLVRVINIGNEESQQPPTTPRVAP